MEYYEGGCVFWCMMECFYHVFCLSRRRISSCLSVLLSGGEIQNLLILVSCWSPAFTLVFTPLVLFSNGNIWLGRLPPKELLKFSDLPSAQAAYSEQLCFIHVCGHIFIYTHVTWTLTFSTSENSYYIAACQVRSVPHRLSVVSVVLCPFILPVPHITPDQATNYSCWHEPPSNSTSLCCLSVSVPSVMSFITFYSGLLFSTPSPSSVMSLSVNHLTH